MAGVRSRNKKEMSVLKINEILRLGLNEGRSCREIARSCQVSVGAVSKYLAKAKSAGSAYDQIKDMDDQQLRCLLKADGITLLGHLKPLPDWVYVHQELKNSHVTLWLLWEEYKSRHPEGYQYTQFCHHYRQWREKLQCSMRQVHKAGEKMFIDYAGDTVPIYSRQTGKVSFQAAIFVACLGASQYTFAEATKDQSLPNWINSHVHGFEYFQGVSEVVVIDNLKSGVTKSCRYEPELNPSYADMARHYGVTILPARVRKPRDKAKVENAVLLVERWILARLRRRTFFSLEELNRAIAELLEALNNRAFKKLPGSRRSQYEQIDRPVLRPLPGHPYRIHYWKKAAVHVDYHIELDKSYYSVPYAFIGQRVDVRYTDKTVEIFSKNKRIASHLKCETPRQYTTTTEHMPRSHQDYKGWTPDRFMAWANQIGPDTAKGIHQLLHSREHLCQSYRRCLGILNLSKSYGRDRLESAARKALSINAFGYKSLSNILKHRLESHRPEPSSTSIHLNHKNVRGEGYFRDATTQPVNLKEAV
jgi:transposase